MPPGPFFVNRARRLTNSVDARLTQNLTFYCHK
nr:MAG TPA: hypothetical protein [Caudoviricetes sp.]